MTYSVRDWSKHFENNRTRELKELRFVILPNKHDGDGYTELLDHPNGAAHYGAWCALVQVASKCDPRGTLLRDGDRPHDSASLARLTRIPAEVFDEVIPRLTAIGWLEASQPEIAAKPLAREVDSEIPQEAARLRASRSRTPLPKSAPELNRSEGKRIEEKEEQTRAPARTDLVVEVFSFWKSHLNHPKAIFDPKRGAAIIARLKEGYTADQLKEAIRGCRLSDFHMGREPGRTDVHDEITLICRDAAHVEKFIGYTLNGGRNGTNKPTGYQTAAERRSNGFRERLAVVEELRTESVRTADEDVRGQPRIARR